MRVTYRLREKNMYMVRKFFPLLSFILLVLAVSGIIYLILGDTKDPKFLIPVYTACLTTFIPTTIILYFDSRSRLQKEEEAEKKELEEIERRERPKET